MAEQASRKSRARTRERNWLGVFTRSAQRVANVLGIIPGDEAGAVKKCRKDSLDLLDKYYENTQYEKLAEWDSTIQADGDYVAVRKRKPLIIYSFPRLLCTRIASKLVGDESWPVQKIEEDPDTTEFINLIVKQSKMQTRLLEPIRRMLGAGSSFVRFALIEGQYKIEHYLSKYCYPVFDALGELQQVKIQYIYDDEESKDRNGNPLKRWFRMDLTKTVDILYDNPEYNSNTLPQFQEVARAEHGLDLSRVSGLERALINIIRTVIHFIKM